MTGSAPRPTSVSAGSSRAQNWLEGEPSLAVSADATARAAGAACWRHIALHNMHSSGVGCQFCPGPCKYDTLLARPSVCHGIMPIRVIQKIAAQAAIHLLAMLCQMSCHKAKTGLSHGCLFHQDSLDNLKAAMSVPSSHSHSYSIGQSLSAALCRSPLSRYTKSSCCHCWLP